jgi:hypothetical protein
MVASLTQGEKIVSHKQVISVLDQPIAKDKKTITLKPNEYCTAPAYAAPGPKDQSSLKTRRQIRQAPQHWSHSPPNLDHETVG